MGSTAGIIARMTDRGLPIVDGAPACPFVAFADDREARSTRPDHRHRCYAEVRPAERAQAHQEAYCLSSAFPVCPTFQDWARREAAAARPGADRGEGASDRAAHAPPPDPERPARAPHRDWSAPPHWASTPAPPPGSLWQEAADDDDGFDADDEAFPTPVIEEDHRAAVHDRVAPRRGRDEDDDDADEFDDADEGDDGPADDPVRALYGDEDPMERSARRRAERAERMGRHRAALAAGETSRRSDPPRGQARPLERHSDDDAPSWERPRRFEAYPTIKTRMSVPGIPRLALVAVAIVVAGIALFFLPALLGVGGPDASPGASSSAPASSGSPAAPSASVVATPTPAPTPVVYVVQSGDTLSKIASRFGVSLQDILDANADTITDPNKIKVGDRIVIPAAVPTGFVDPGASESLPPP